MASIGRTNGSSIETGHRRCTLICSSQTNMKAISDFLVRHIRFWVLGSLSLGLAPFFPEPHIWGKIQWIAGGAVGMAPIDWFDTVLHGTPWLLLVLSLIFKLKNQST